MQENIDPEILKVLQQVFGGKAYFVHPDNLPVFLALNTLANITGTHMLDWVILSEKDKPIFISILTEKIAHHVKCHTANPQGYKAIPQILLDLAASLETQLNDPTVSICSEGIRKICLDNTVDSLKTSFDSVNWDKELEKIDQEFGNGTGYTDTI